MRTIIFSFVIILLAPLSCGNSDASIGQNPSTQSLNQENYWDQGKAEITTYHLSQARYGELREGSATLIFVKEPFSKTKHVKLDSPSGDDRVDVLKLNKVKKFNTGIYPYSMMSSVFSPINDASDGRALKITTSSQEWCGHTFTQCNFRDEEWNYQQYSYFESEGDDQFGLGDVYMEDELWNQIRINPSNIPTELDRMVPSTFYMRLSHIEPAAYDVRITTQELGDLQVCQLEYPQLKRTMTIRYKKEFPYTIESWEESYSSGWGNSARQLVTKAELNKREMLDYWNLNSNDDIHWRKELGLD